MKDRIQLLIDIIFDESAREDEVDDAIMYLGDFNEPRVLDALVKFAKNPGRKDFSLDVCGESIAKIWVKNKSIDRSVFLSLPKITRAEILGYFSVADPESLKLVT